MFFQNLLLVLSLTSFLRDFHISCCEEDCADKPVFTPSRLVVKYGDPTSAMCSICQHCQSTSFGLEVPQGVRTENGTELTWTVDSLTEFAPAVLCYYNDDNTGEQCCTKLPVTVYKPPDSVSINFNPQMFEGRQDTLHCDVSNVAPVENLTVTFYRGQTRLGQTQSNDIEKYPASGVYTLTITPSKEDDGGQFWCEAKLELGPEGPQPPPVVRSERVTATVHYMPQLISTSPSEITVREGDPLQPNCSAVGNPSPSYTWTLPFTVSSPLNGSVFTINSVSSEHRGQYTCSVANNMGAVTVEFKVFVRDEDCADKPVFTPSRLVVKYGDPTSARCSICQHCQSDAFGLEAPQGVRTENGAKLTWTVDRLTEFAPDVLCYYNEDNTGQQCCTKLPVTVYKPPDIVSIYFVSQLFEGRQDTLYCDVSDVAPVENLTVTFYRGQTRLGQSQTQFNDTEKKPVSPIYTLNITPSKEDDGGQFWCEAKLELGPEGPQPPPVVRSERVTATVHYKPHLEVSSQPDQIVITEGDPLQLNCTAVGNPRPSYTWTVPLGGVSPSSSVLSISSVTTADNGEYSCLVSNSMGNVTVVYQVEVTVSYTGLIIAAFIIPAAVIVLIGVVVYIRYYRNNRTGQYNMKDVFQLQTQHSLVPTAELDCEKT